MLPRSWRLVDAVALLLGALCAALVRAFAPSRPLPRTVFVYLHRGLNQVAPVVNRPHDRIRQEVFALQAKKSNASAPVGGASSSPKFLGRSQRRGSETGGVTQQTPLIDYKLPQTRRSSIVEVADAVPTVSLNARITTSPGHLKEVSRERYLALLEGAVRLHDKKIKSAAKQKGSKRSRTDTSPFALATEPERKKCTMDHDVKEAEAIRNGAYMKLIPNETVLITEDSPSTSHQQKKRRSKYFWSNAENARKEVAIFWERLGVVSDKVPNNTLLTHFRAHGLRHAIQSRGGREALARWLGVEAIPGRWTQALQTDEVAKLVRDGTLGSNFIGPNKGGTPLVGDAHKKWPSQATNLRAYWQQNLHAEVAAFAEMFQGEAGLPVVWLPRMVDMSKAGRRDIENAVQRFGGYDAVVSRMGMVHHMEWRFFMDQLETLRELKKCLTLNGEVTKVMPRKRTLLERKKTTLVEGLVRLGGVELIARKMGLAYSTPSSHGYPDGMLFGKFDLTFAVDLLEFVFHREYDRSPVVTHDARKYPELDGNCMFEPWRYPVNIMMPSIKELEDAGEVGRALLAKIVEYGGFENVGRRLYLGWSRDDEMKSRLMIRHKPRQVIRALLLGQQRKLLKERSGLLEQLEMEARREAQIAMERKQEALKQLAQQRHQLQQHVAHRKMVETVHGSSLIGPGRAALSPSDERVWSTKTKARNARKS